MIWSTGRRPRETISIALGQQCGPKWPPMIRSSFTSPFKKEKKMDYWIYRFEALNFPFLIILVPWYFNKKYFFSDWKLDFLFFWIILDVFDDVFPFFTDFFSHLSSIFLQFFSFNSLVFLNLSDFHPEFQGSLKYLK